MTKKIKLKDGVFALVDDEDFERISQYRWGVRIDGKRKYARRVISRKEAAKKGVSRFISMHHDIMGKPFYTLRIIHINNNGLDNRRKNLRLGTNQESQRNSRPQQGRKGKYKGVSVGYKGSFVAFIRIDKKLKYLGTFSEEKDAAFAYNRAAMRVFGEFAKLNIIK